MNRVRLLPEHVANQIAAGEVVERPASVVKELVENALDAGAARISVEIQAGGRSLIRVTDDGLGMSRDDALLCFERHATSKIRRAEDLHAVLTMGFRGEALPSIASVSRLTLTTREREASDVPPSGGAPAEDRLKAGLQTAAEGTQVVINGGKITEVKAAGSAPGTSVEVRQLFFNLPARRKFLRSEETERAHIQHYLMLAALAFPEVAFTFTHDGRTVWQLPAAVGQASSLSSSATGTGKMPVLPSSRLEALRERMRGLHGGDLKLLAVDSTGTIDVVSDTDAEEAALTQSQIANRKSQIRLWGFIGAPGVARSTRDDQNLFVNRRPVENRGLNFALLEGYHTALMKGRYPVCGLFLEIDPAEVDVNIHPAKREVKFHRERDVRQFVAEAVRQTLLKFHGGETSNIQHSTSNIELGRSERVEAIGRPFEVKPTPEFSTPSLPSFPLPAKPIPEWPSRPVEQKPLPMGFATTRPAAPTAPDPRPQTPNPIAASPLLSIPLRVVGVIGRLYVVLESDRGLVLMDQHAAHERVLFEQMLNRLEQGGAASQRLLLPETVELSPRDAQFLRGQLPVLSRLGVGLAEFGDRTFLLDALPPFVKAADARRFALELVDELKAAGESVNSLRLGEHTIAKTVCRHAVKANDPLNGPELENLVNDLRRCAMPYTCPHGRPTLIEMSLRELEKKFGRTQ
ncbi:MAG: DNA mismatch repair endonuclease MutL [Verrucomicrobia bacterium]|nr:DNA mismatch repair endonuclease MutL [Verrucomicrobiota bacterium]